MVNMMNVPTNEDIQIVAGKIAYEVKAEEIHAFLMERGYSDYGAFLAYHAGKVDLLMWSRYPLTR